MEVAMSELIFEGNVQVYLQGKNALLPHGTLGNNATYFIGSRQSPLTLRDYRHKQINAARHILSGKNGFEFADVFNEPALVKVYSDPEKNKLEIEMHEPTAGNKKETLWLGVIDNHEMSVQKIKWEFLHAIGKKRIAFAALVKQA
jgi:hypothetical protein